MRSDSFLFRERLLSSPPGSSWIRRLRNPPKQPGRKRKGPSLATAGPPRKQPLLCLLPPTIENIFLPTISVLPLCSQSAQPFHPLATAVSSPCHTGQGLAGHPRRVNMSNDYGKTRLFTPIRSKTTTLPRCARHHSARRERSCSLRRGDESAGKRSHRNRSSSPERVRLLQLLLPRPQKRWQPATYSRSQIPESPPDENIVQDDHSETDPPATLRSLKATHVPGNMNQGADILSRNNVSSEEWTLHPLAVQRIWEIFGKVRVDIFASKDNSHCLICFTRSTDALAHEWPSLPLYAFPPVVLLPQLPRQVREQRHKLILIATLEARTPRGTLEARMPGGALEAWMLGGRSGSAELDGTSGDEGRLDGTSSDEGWFMRGAGLA